MLPYSAGSFVFINKPNYFPALIHSVNQGPVNMLLTCSNILFYVISYIELDIFIWTVKLNSHFILLLAAVGFTFGSAICILGQLRQKNDIANHFIAGNLAGAALGFKSKPFDYFICSKLNT